MEADINRLILKNLHLFALYNHVLSSKNTSVAKYCVVRCDVLFSAGQVCALYAAQFRKDKDSANVSGLTDDRLEKYSVGYFMTCCFMYLRPIRRFGKTAKSDH